MTLQLQKWEIKENKRLVLAAFIRVPDLHSKIYRGIHSVSQGFTVSNR